MLSACYYAAALLCLAPLPPANKRTSVIGVANAKALQLPLRPKPGWPVSPVLRVLLHAVGHLRQPWDPRDRARQEPNVGARCPKTPVDGRISGYDYDYDYMYIYVYICICVCVCVCVCVYGITTAVCLPGYRGKRWAWDGE